MADIKNPVKLKRSRLVKDDSYAERLLEALYRARRLAPERYLTRAELAYFFFKPDARPATLAELNAALEKAQWAEATRQADRTLFLLALDTLDKRNFLETVAGASRLHIEAFNRMRKIFQSSTTLPQENMLERIFPSEKIVRKSFESLGWQDPPQRVVDTAEELRQPNNQAGCFLGLLLLLIIVLGGLYVVTRTSGESSSVAYAPPEAIAEPHSQPGGEPGPVVESPAFYPLDLRDARDANGPVGEVLTLGNIFVPPLDEQALQGVRYGLDEESAFLESETFSSQRSNWLMLEVGQANVRRVYLLLNLCNTSPDFTGGANLFGKPIGQVTFYFSQGISKSWGLIAGVNIRDFLVEFEGVINERYEEDSQIEVLRNTYNGFAARIDQVTVDVPEEYWGLVLERIEIVDLSRNYETANPGIVWFGGALEVGE